MNFKHKYDNHKMKQTYPSYREFKSKQKEQRLLYLISTRYLKLLGKFIESTYPGLKFDVFIRHRDPKVKDPQWYGQTYMELRIYDIICRPIFSPITFDSGYKTPHLEEPIYCHGIYEEIDHFIPELNKHILITFRPLISPHTPIHNMDIFDPKPFECWGEYFSREYRKHASSYINYDDFGVPPDRFGM